MADPKALLRQIWWAGVTAVGGYASVARAVETGIPAPDQIIAVGKAAPAMAKAAQDRFGPLPTLVVTKDGHGDGVDLGQAELIEAAHPVPDARSLHAGQRLIETVVGLPSDAHLLFLVSGGASALAEAPVDGLTLDDLAAENARLLASGLDIAAMNARRRELSRIKGGRLLAEFPGARLTVLGLSDVQFDDPAVIGSGIGTAPLDRGFEVQNLIVASNAHARAAAKAEAARLGIPVSCSEESLYGDVAEVAQQAAACLRRAEGLCIWGGEPTIVLPANPGKGGRNQALALEMARLIAGEPDLHVLVGGTDGSDGPTEAAGGIVDGTTWRDAARTYQDQADSGTFLEEIGTLFTTGPTGTNVMDLSLGLRSP